MRSFTSSLDPICILSSLSWKEGEKKEREKKERKKERKKKKKREKKKKKSVRKKGEKKKSDISRINLVPEFGFEYVLRTVQ